MRGLLVRGLEPRLRKSLVEICESQTSVISVPDLALADRAIYRARVLKTHKGRHKTRAIKVI